MWSLALWIKQAKKKPPPRAGVWDLIKPRSLGVGNAAIGQSRLVRGASHFLLVVLLAAIGQGHLRFLRNQVPVPWPGDLRLAGQVKLLVAVATNLL